MTFLAYRVEEQEEGMKASWQEFHTDSLPAGEVLIQVQYSSLNYKDTLSANGNKGVTKSFPHTPGIDAAGIVLESTSSTINVGDEVIVFGYDLGMNTAGGFGQQIRVPANWVLKKPASIRSEEHTSELQSRPHLVCR